MTRPIIGISSYVSHARWGAWDRPAALAPMTYVDAVLAAGGRPILIPPTTETVAETLSRLDGLIIAGGPDIHSADDRPDALGREETFERERDEAELALLRAAAARDMPVLGICRGMQLINLLHGGTLWPHLPDVVGHEGHRLVPGRFELHSVKLSVGSRVGLILGPHVEVHSSHHQGVDVLGTGLVVSGRAPDGVIEAIEDERRSFELGVLWHPEESNDLRLFAALVNAARADHLDRPATCAAVAS